MSKESLNLGFLAEEEAVKFLKNNGYRILRRNYKVVRLGEIDIVARDKDTVCFIEVKCRKSDRFGTGPEAVSLSKQIKISKAALCFMKENNSLDTKARFDVIEVEYPGTNGKINLIKNAFELSERYTY